MNVDSFNALLTQYTRPDGRAIGMVTQLPIKARGDYLDMVGSNCLFEAEVLKTGDVSLTIVRNGEYVDIEVVENSPSVQEAMVKMLERRAWKIP